MIIRRNKDYYFISSREDLNGEILKPYIPKPQEFMFQGVGDWKTKRISIFPTVKQALAARTRTAGEVLTVYRVTGIYPSDIYTPSVIESPLANILSERWALSDIQLRKIGNVEVGGPEESVSVPVGRQKKKIQFYEFKDLRPPYEQKKLKLR